MNDQPAPRPNRSTPIWELVIKDMHERDAVGRKRYGTPLQAHNGRDALIDAYQEALDLAVYLRQLIAERDGDNGSGGVLRPPRPPFKPRPAIALPRPVLPPQAITPEAELRRFEAGE